jgi:methionyl-tRNA synthetase
VARHLITSALPYINGVKHLGNLVGSQLPADVYARFLRQQGHEVVAICATDEHGTPAELAAEEAGVPSRRTWATGSGWRGTTSGAARRTTTTS